MPKTRMYMKLDKDLVDFDKTYAAENRTTISNIITQYLLALKKRIEGQEAERILSHPAFQRAMEKAQTKLQAGKAKWHSYDEVFGE